MGGEARAQYFLSSLHWEKMRVKFERSADHHRHLILSNGCSHFESVFKATSV